MLSENKVINATLFDIVAGVCCELFCGELFSMLGKYTL